MKIYYIPIFFLSNRPWPLFISISLMFLCNNLIICLNSVFRLVLLINIVLIILIIFFWWNDVIIESTYLGFHTKYIMTITVYSIILFIISEIFFFIRFFWSFFHSMFSPDIAIGSNWPYLGIISVNYIDLPLMNSLLLIRRGCSITWRHYIIIIKNNKRCIKSLIITIILGLTFILCQIVEYLNCIFRFSDGIFGSIFFIRTGFHGIHVIIGTIFIIFILIRVVKNHFSRNHIIGFEFSIWYWHFVDVVWLYLYLIIYWLGS